MRAPDFRPAAENMMVRVDSQRQTIQAAKQPNNRTTEQANKQADRAAKPAINGQAADAGSKKEDASAKQKRSVPGLRTWSPTVLLAWLEPA